MTDIEATQVLYAISTSCAVIFLFVLLLGDLQLRRTRISRREIPKAAFSLLLSIILSAYLVRAYVLNVQYESGFRVSLFASVLAALGLVVLLPQNEHRQSQRASDIATLYLLASVLCDIVILTVPSSPAEFPYAILLRSCVHSTLLVLECCITPANPKDLFKEQSPEERHGVLSRVLFTWVNPILLRGYRNIITHEDLPYLSQDMKARHMREAMLHSWSRRSQHESKKTLPLALLSCLKEPFIAAIMPRLSLIAFRYAQPALVKSSIRYVASGSASAQDSYGFWLILSAAVIYTGIALSTAIYQHRINRLRLMTRSALVGLIHEVTLRSPSIASDNGEATTLMSTDAGSLDGIGRMVHEIWAYVLEVLIGMSLLASQVGWIWPLLLVLIYLCSHMSRFVAKNLQPRQRDWNVATQHRIAATGSAIGFMKVVKMLGLQQHLTRRIHQLRQDELDAASKLRSIMVYYNASANALGIFSPAITLVSFAVIAVARGGALDTETAFTTTAILSMVTHPANMVMTIVPQVVAAFSGFERIQKFLTQESLKDNRGSLPRPLTSDPEAELLDMPSHHLATACPAIQINHLQVGDRRALLENINLEVPVGSFVILSGPTGCGKSTLIRTILGEVTPVRGVISLSTKRIAYCAQRPWLPNSTIKETIYGATCIDTADDQIYSRWYHEVIEICCLRHDFDALPDGDQTQIGSRGLNLSGGQRQRVALARALFARCDLLLLDDTFSGLDGDTERAVFYNLFGSGGLIRRMRTTAVLVSNSSQYFHAADHIVVLGECGILDQGKYDDIKVKAASIWKFPSGHPTQDSSLLSVSYGRLSAQLRAMDETEADLARQTGDPALYAYYLGFVNVTTTCALVASTALYAFFISIPQYWLQLWTDSAGRNTTFYALGFMFLSFMSWSSTSWQMWIVLSRLAPQSGSRLHYRLLCTIMSAPLSYFSNTDNGSILNRFSEDIQIIDKQLPSALQALVVQIFKLTMQIILLSMAERWLTVSLPACIVVVYLVQKGYLRTSRQLRFLELESRAVVFSSFLETIDGLETIRSFGWSEAARGQNIRSLDESQRPEFLLLCLQRWLNLVLDLLATAIATSVVALAVTFRGRVTGAQVGIALNVMLVANTTLLKLIESWTTLETSMGAIARLKTLEEMTPSEDRDGPYLEPPDNWPSRGNVVFTDITASYQPGSVALRNVSLNVKAGQKLLICGRTGSGKSTLLLTLLRLLEIQSGKIELDSIDIKYVRLELLRQQCFIGVSQDPLVLTNETLRFNLDPSTSLSDDSLVAALTTVGLWSIFCEGTAFVAGIFPRLGEHPVLDQKVSELQKLSVGQSQLFAVCRALVKASSLRERGVKPVILLDEVTSSLDTVTESMIHRIIDTEFLKRGHTVIVVAHRLGSTEALVKRGRDTLALMADGQVQEVIEGLQSRAFQYEQEVE